MVSAEPFLRRIGRFSGSRPWTTLGIVILVTLVAGYGTTLLRMNLSFSDQLPQNIPAVENQNMLEDEFGGTDLIMIAIFVDKDAADSDIVDIRSPEALNTMLRIQERLEEEPEITYVFSVADAVETAFDSIPEDSELLRQFFSSEQMSPYINSDYTMTTIIAKSEIGIDPNKLARIFENLKEDIRKSNVPYGLKTSITGTPAIIHELLMMINRDMVTTTLISGLVIVLILIIMYVSLTKGIVPLTPLIFGLIWAVGAMGYLGIPISMVTVAIGSMIVGMGIDYGVHMFNRFREERSKGNDFVEAAEDATGSVGKALLGSAGTTMAGFLAILAASIPIMHDLGISAALGIFFSMVAAIVAIPPIAIIEEKLVGKLNRGAFR